MADIRSSKRVKELAAVLVEQCRSAGVAMFPEKAADILATRVRATAAGLRITERYALDRYFTAESVTKLADVLIRQIEDNRQLADEAEPYTLSITDAAHVVAAFGIAVKIAARHVEDTDALPLTNKVGDATILFGLEITSAVTADITLAGQDLVYSRTVLTQVLDKLRTGRWSCICEADHEEGQCEIQNGLIQDLGRLGSGVSGDRPPVDGDDPARLWSEAQERFINSLGLDLEGLGDDTADGESDRR